MLPGAHPKYYLLGFGARGALNSTPRQQRQEGKIESGSTSPSAWATRAHFTKSWAQPYLTSRSGWTSRTCPRQPRRLVKGRPRRRLEVRRPGIHHFTPARFSRALRQWGRSLICLHVQQGCVCHRGSFSRTISHRAL